MNTNCQLVSGHIVDSQMMEHFSSKVSYTTNDHYFKRAWKTINQMNWYFSGKNAVTRMATGGDRGSANERGHLMSVKQFLVKGQSLLIFKENHYF